ncbi:11560_t:CDS:2, partial [Dentiscutata erythropus]
EATKAEESHLYLYTKIVTPATFERHQGFDLANLKYPLSEVLRFKASKTETYRTFKAKIASKFEVSVEQIRFRVFSKRLNKTVRPDVPIKDDCLGM